MANISFRFLNSSFAIDDTQFTTFDTAGLPFTSSFTFLALNFNDLNFSGSGFTYSGAIPNGGTVTSTSIDVGGGDIATGAEVRITNLNLDINDFGIDSGTAAEQNSQYWQTALQGDDTFSLTVQDYDIDLVVAGDGSNLLSNSGVSFGGDDFFAIGTNALNSSELYGDYLDVADGAFAIGGGDRFTASAGAVVGDVRTVENGGSAIGGDDTFTPEAFGDNAAFVGDALSVDNGGSLSAGDDFFDFRNTDTSAGVGALVVGDVASGGSSAAVAAGDDTVHGTDTDDVILGESFFFVGTTVGGDDLLIGRGGDDNILGQTGDDILNGGAGNDTLDGGDGIDTVDYRDQIGGVSVNLISGEAQSGGFLNGGGFYQGGAVEDEITDVENIIGSNFSDRLIGTSEDNIIRGETGNDRISGLSGNDQLFGGGATDMLEGGAGNDTLNGGTGFDTLDGGGGGDVADYSDRDGGVNINLFNGTGDTGGFLNGGGGYSGGFTEDTLVNIEHITGSNFGDRLVGDNSSNDIMGGGGADRISGLNGSDELFGGASSDTLEGGAGNDLLNGGTGFDTLDGGDGQFDIVDYSDRTGGVNINLINGTGRTGGEIVGGVYTGGFTEDTITNVESVIGSNFGDRIVSLSSSSFIDGGGGGDIIDTFSGGDFIDGGFGDDLINARSGDDTIIGGAGDDSIEGGVGDDFIIFQRGHGNDTLTDFTVGGSEDVIQLDDFDSDFDEFSEVMAVASEVGANVVFDFGNGDTITVQNTTIAEFTADDFIF